MTGRLNLIFAAVLFWLATLDFAGAARAANFTAALDRDTIALGEQATLTLTIEGSSKNVPVPVVPGLGFGHPITSSSQNIDLVSGQMSSTISVAYSVTPQREGEFNIPAFTADVNGQRLATTPLKLVVNKPSPPTADEINSGNALAFVKLKLPKKKFYAGETAVADLQIFFRQDAQLARQPNLAALLADGFTVGKIADGGQRQAQVGNNIFNVISARVALTVNKTGDISIGPATVGLVLVVPTGSRELDPNFARMGIQFYRGGEETRQLSPASETLSAQSLPLPDENKPANFSGAVGQFELAASAGPTNVTAGDPITVRLQISGRGALDSVTLPEQNWQNFKTYPPTTKLETSDQFGFQGKKTFEQIISPLNSDVHEIPVLNFSYFDPEDGKYHTLAQSAVMLTVKAAGATVMPAVATAKNSAADNQPPQDILPIKENLGTLEIETVPLVAQAKFFLIMNVPVFALLAARIWRVRTDSLANNPRLRRQRAVAQLVNGGLGDLNRFAAENKSSEFFAMLFRLLQEQLGERLDCPSTAITEADVDKRLIYIGASPSTLESLRELFQLCNQARYAPIQTRQELAAVAAKFKKVAGELQSLKP